MFSHTHRHINKQKKVSWLWKERPRLFFWRNIYWSALVPQPFLLPWKSSGCPPAFRHYSFCRTPHLKYLTVFWICISRYLLSKLYSDLMLCTPSDTFRIILAYSALYFFRYTSVYSIIFSIIKRYPLILRHYY